MSFWYFHLKLVIKPSPRGLHPIQLRWVRKGQEPTDQEKGEGAGGSNTHSVGHYKKMYWNWRRDSCETRHCTVQCGTLNTRTSELSAFFPLDWQKKWRGLGDNQMDITPLSSLRTQVPCQVSKARQGNGWEGKKQKQQTCKLHRTWGADKNKNKNRKTRKPIST